MGVGCAIHHVVKNYRKDQLLGEEKLQEEEQIAEGTTAEQIRSQPAYSCTPCTQIIRT